MSVVKLQLQSPPPGPFCCHDLKWDSVSNTQSRGRKQNTVLQIYQVARISWDRREDFLSRKGTRGTYTFYSEKLTVRLQRLAELAAAKTPRKDTFLEYEFRHCNHGPENHTETGDVLAKKQQGQR